MTDAIKLGLSIIAFCLAVAVPNSSQAIDDYGLSLGSGKSDTDILRVSGRFHWDQQWFSEGDWYLGGYWELGLAYWDSGKNNASGSDSLGELSFTPVFRLQPKSRQGLLQPYLEFALVGPRLLSTTSIGDRRFSTALQFGSHLGLGARLGTDGRFEIGYRYQHISNGGIKNPNNGMEFHLLNLGYRY